jgi:hypothetical protein
MGGRSRYPVDAGDKAQSGEWVEKRAAEWPLRHCAVVQVHLTPYWPGVRTFLTGLMVEPCISCRDPLRMDRRITYGEVWSSQLLVDSRSAPVRHLKLFRADTT